MTEDARAAVAGAAAAVAWIAAEPLARRVTGTTFSDVRLLGRPLSRRHWRVVGTALHVANGAVAAVAFRRLGLHGWRQGVVAFQVENVLAWPLLVVVDRWHPDRRDGTWPPLLLNRRVFAHEAAVHALFGALVGAAASPPRR